MPVTDLDAPLPGGLLVLQVPLHDPVLPLQARHHVGDFHPRALALGEPAPLARLPRLGVDVAPAGVAVHALEQRVLAALHAPPEEAPAADADPGPVVGVLAGLLRADGAGEVGGPGLAVGTRAAVRVAGSGHGGV